MANAQDWQIRSRAHSCTGTAVPFENGDEVYSRLRQTDEGYIREDYLREGWNRVKAEPTLSSWKSIYRKPPPPAEEAVKKESAESLLRKLIEAEDDSQQNTIFILAVMLERKRILIEREVQRQPDGETMRLYEYKGTGETFLIQDPGLKLAELETVQDEVVQMLGGAKRGGGSNPPQEPPGDDGRVSVS